MTEPAPDWSRRFGGTQRLYGQAAAARIRGLRVMVVGIGGVGTWAAEGLARLGVGALTLVDMDHVAESNINRQLHALDATLGQAKVEAMRARVAAFHPECRVDVIDDWVSPDNWLTLLGAGEAPHVVIDACDQLRAKAAMAGWALRERRPLVCVGAAGGKVKPQAVEAEDLAAVTHDPLLAKLRYALRRHHGAAKHGAMGLRCVFSREAVAPPQGDGCDWQEGDLNCHGYGSAATVTGTFGLVAAAQAIDLALR
jgi:tRNA A37 threonylcarbamoyladenosine dehydratase